jgi:hypothetical protein
MRDPSLDHHASQILFGDSTRLDASSPSARV